MWMHGERWEQAIGRSALRKPFCVRRRRRNKGETASATVFFDLFHRFAPFYPKPAAVGFRCTRRRRRLGEEVIRSRGECARGRAARRGAAGWRWSRCQPSLAAPDAVGGECRRHPDFVPVLHPEKRHLATTLRGNEKSGPTSTDRALLFPQTAVACSSTARARVWSFRFALNSGFAARAGCGAAAELCALLAWRTPTTPVEGRATWWLDDAPLSSSSRVSSLKPDFRLLLAPTYPREK